MWVLSSWDLARRGSGRVWRWLYSARPAKGGVVARGASRPGTCTGCGAACVAPPGHGLRARTVSTQQQRGAPAPRMRRWRVVPPMAVWQWLQRRLAPVAPSVRGRRGGACAVGTRLSLSAASSRGRYLALFMGFIRFPSCSTARAPRQLGFGQLPQPLPTAVQLGFRVLLVLGYVYPV
jgi:hypothetical protein